MVNNKLIGIFSFFLLSPFFVYGDESSGLPISPYPIAVENKTSIERIYEGELFILYDEPVVLAENDWWDNPPTTGGGGGGFVGNPIGDGWVVLLILSIVYTISRKLSKKTTK